VLGGGFAAERQGDGVIADKTTLSR
jgi:hypothetical protein